MLAAIREYNEQSDRFVVRPRYVDPVPGRARRLATQAQALGVPAQAYEAPIEEFLGTATATRPSALILNLDRPAALARTIRISMDTSTPVLGYLLIRMPHGDLYGLRMAVQGDERARKGEAVLFFEQLSGVVARSGSSAVVGMNGRPEHLAAEPRYRTWFAEHMQSNVGKLVAGLEPESSPLELTRDAERTLTLMLRDHRNGWSAPGVLARAVVAEPETPIVPGEEFAVGEIGPDGIRFHPVRVRKLDGEVAVRGASRYDPEAIADAEAARRASERDALSRSRPAFTTD
jgi:hypothetical protein